MRKKDTQYDVNQTSLHAVFNPLKPFCSFQAIFFNVRQTRIIKNNERERNNAF